MYDILVIAAILGCGWLGLRLGLRDAVVAGLELLACLAVATVGHEPLADLLEAGLQAVLGPLVPQAWLVPLAFGGLLWGTLAALRRVLHGQPEAEDPLDGEEEAGIGLLVNRAGGALAGAVSGLLLVGAALVTLSMVPLLSGLKPVGDRMRIDAGRIALEAGGMFAGDRHEGRSLVIHGEPASRQALLSARLSSEPWLDMDGDSMPTDADRFRDVDGSGSFTKDLYYTDVDGDGVRRVGLYDKYVAGCWGSTLNHDDRQRPVEKKPPPKPAAPTPVKAPAAAGAAPATPAAPPTAVPGATVAPAPAGPAAGTNAASGTASASGTTAASGTAPAPVPRPASGTAAP